MERMDNPGDRWGRRRRPGGPTAAVDRCGNSISESAISSAGMWPIVCGPLCSYIIRAHGPGKTRSVAIKHFAVETDRRFSTDPVLTDPVYWRSIAGGGRRQQLAS